jgi:hypothetical protein
MPQVMKRKTYSNRDLSSSGSGGHLAVHTVGTALVDLLEANATIGIAHDISNDGVGQLIDDVEVGRLAVDGKGSVSRTAARRHSQRLDGRNAQAGLVDRVDANEVGAEIRNQDEGAGRVGDGLVRVGGFLPVRIGTGLLELVDGGVKELESSRVGGVPRGESRSATSIGEAHPEMSAVPLVLHPLAVENEGGGKGRRYWTTAGTY